MSTIKVDTINTRTGSGDITFSRPTVLTAGDIVEADIADNAVTLAKLAGGTDGQIITYDASGDPVAVGPGTSGQILTSAGAGAPPTFAAAAAGGDTRNFIIDGDMTQWPEGTAATTHVTNGYTHALWEAKLSHDGASTWERSTDVPTVAASGHQSAYSLLIKCTGTDSSIAAHQTLRTRYFVTGSDYTHLHSQQVTFSFWCKTASANTGDTYYFALSNSAENRSYVQNFAPTSTWTEFSYTITLDTSGTWLFTEADIGLKIGFHLVSGSDYDDATVGSWVANGDFWAASTSISNFLDSTSNEIYFSQIGLYLGSTAPTFLSLPIATTKDQVEYYVETRGITDAASTYPKIAMAHAIGTTVADCTIFYRTKRVVPTFTLKGTITDYDYNSVTTGAVTSVSSYFGQTKNGATVRVNCSTTTANSGGNLTGDTTAEHGLIDARH